MATRLTLLLALAFSGACADRSWDSAARQELLRRGALDQAIRDTLVASLRELGQPDSGAVRRMLALDSANAEWLRAAVQSRGWPQRSVVGEDGAAAAFLIVQHAGHVPEFQAQVLEFLEPLMGQGEVSAQEFALLSDRVAVQAARQQVYGTQATIRDGGVVLDPIADSAQVDARRARIGLPPLAEYVRTLDSAYAQAPRP